ncbi:hypothetical protein HanIR_Chr09g0430741 [Helianthus annuus]|nr:hypothetical protein HanIR_Chr09g0430741 [Helianthus annuus]
MKNFFSQVHLHGLFRRGVIREQGRRPALRKLILNKTITEVEEVKRLIAKGRKLERNAAPKQNAAPVQNENEP